MRTRLMAFLAGLLLRCLHFSFRYTRLGPPFVGPCVVAFWHGGQLPLLGQLPAEGGVVPVSLSTDGRLQALILRRLGLQVVDGSSSRGAVRATLGLLKGLRRGGVALIAVDGPRGPRCTPKPGAIFLSQRTDAPILPVGVAVSRGLVLKRSWDQYLLPAPFARVVVFVGEPWTPSKEEAVDSLCGSLALRIEAANAEAHATLCRATSYPKSRGAVARTDS